MSSSSNSDEPLISGNDVTDTDTHHSSSSHSNKLSLIPLIFLIYFEVSGGPYGEECAVGAAGPLLAIIGFVVFPFIWSVPEALITAELSTAFPGNGGFVVWAHEAFGPFAASMMATWKFLSGVINLASYPVLCVDYLSLVVPQLSSGLPRRAAVLGSTLVMSLLNYLGLTVVGYTAVALGVVSYVPFLVMAVAAVPKIVPSRWVSLGRKKKDWTLFFNTLFWNLNFWDNASTLAGEVRDPKRNYPKALLAAVILTCLGYLVPLLATTGAVPLTDQDEWVDGFLATAARLIAGEWLEIWIGISSIFSVVGMFEAQLSTSAYQILGMSELGILPRFFGLRSVHFDTPWVGILVSIFVPLTFSFMDFTDIISSANFVYALGMLLEFASFLWLRRKFPAKKRPFLVPLKFHWLVVMCLIPALFLVYIMSIATKIVILISFVITVLGVGWYFFINMCRSRMWFVFNKSDEQLE